MPRDCPRSDVPGIVWNTLLSNFCPLDVFLRALKATHDGYYRTALEALRKDSESQFAEDIATVRKELLETLPIETIIEFLNQKQLNVLPISYAE